MQKLRILIIFLLVSTGLLFADNKSIVIQSANIVIDVLEGTSSVRHLTPYMVDIARNGHLLPEETKSKLESFGFNFSESLVTMTRPNLDFYYDSKNFRIHYDLTGTDAVDPTDSDGDSTPDYIETMATVFEEVYNHDINELGYIPPPSDGTDGGSPAYDIYVKNLGTSIYARTYYATLLGDNENSPEKEYNAYSSYIHMNSNYDGFPSS